MTRLNRSSLMSDRARVIKWAMSNPETTIDLCVAIARAVHIALALENTESRHSVLMTGRKADESDAGGTLKTDETMTERRQGRCDVGREN